MTNKNIILIGFMGVGKSSIGRMLADKIDYDFVDTDQLIEAKTKSTIKQLFFEKGEDYFRQVEAEVVEEVALNSKSVIATGGGVVLNPSNIVKLRQNGIIIHLNASNETIIKNLVNDKSRPLIYDGNMLERITTLLEERKYCYDCYDAQINVDGLTVEGINDTICDLLKGNGLNEC